MAKKRRKFKQCPNCNFIFKEVDNYCPNCGQENHDLNVPVKHLAHEFLEGTLHYDTKFWLTLKHLLFKPGFLTEEFNIGRRASYVPPFRLYVFISLVFFFTLAISPNTMQVDMGRQAAVEKMDADERQALTRVDSVRQSMDLPNTESYTLFGKNINELQINPALLREKLIKNTSFMMFLLMPLFGYLLYLFHRKQKRNYVEHLMFSIHLHSFFFFLFTVYLAFSFILPKNIDLLYIVVPAMFVYAFIAMRRVYKQSYWKTLVRFIPVTFIYSFTIVLALLVNVVLSIFLLS